jgi:hypothetical protein
MSEIDVISRRKALSFLGLAALATAVPAILPISEAEAQQPSPPTTPQPGSPPAGSPPADAQTGTERRQERRTGRVKRRVQRRSARKKGRSERRQLRRTGGEEKM